MSLPPFTLRLFLPSSHASVSPKKDTLASFIHLLQTPHALPGFFPTFHSYHCLSSSLSPVIPSFAASHRGSFPPPSATSWFAFVALSHFLLHRPELGHSPDGHCSWFLHFTFEHISTAAHSLCRGPGVPDSPLTVTKTAQGVQCGYAYTALSDAGSSRMGSPTTVTAT